MRTHALVATTILTLASACQELPRGDAAGAVEVSVAALSLPGVGDIVWDLEVVNGASATVWQRRITSSRYGDGAGSATYVGTCDADPAVAQNTVRLWVVGVFEDAVSDANAGTFNGTHDGAVGTALPFENPTTPAAPLEVTVTCRENADMPVEFNVALMRPAEQGFFDIAVSFNDIFCSAKFDCCEDDGAGGCDPLTLLFDDTGARAPTHVLGFACTAGAATNVTTQLYLDAVELDCTDPTAADAFDPPDVVLDPSAGPGNACTAGELATCPAVTSGAAQADTWLYQFATYRGLEALTSEGVVAQKVYWNLAFGVNPAATACRLRAVGTAEDAADTSDLVDLGTIAEGAIYPLVQWDVALDSSCTSHPLTFGDANAPVRTAYTAATAGARTFAFGFGPGLPAGSFCQPECDAMSSCVSGVCVPPAPRVEACVGLPANAVWNTASQITQTWDGSAWTPSTTGTYNTTASTTECRFTCPATHPLWDGTACVNTRVQACTGLPTNAVWNTASQITQTWDGSAWAPSTTGSYNTTASTTECRFVCDAAFPTWNGSTCTNATVSSAADGEYLLTSSGFSLVAGTRAPTPSTYSGTFNGTYAASSRVAPNGATSMTLNGTQTFVLSSAALNTGSTWCLEFYIYPTSAGTLWQLATNYPQTTGVSATGALTWTWPSIDTNNPYGASPLTMNAWNHVGIFMNNGAARWGSMINGKLINHFYHSLFANWTMVTLFSGLSGDVSDIRYSVGTCPYNTGAGVTTYTPTTADYTKPSDNSMIVRPR